MTDHEAMKMALHALKFSQNMKRCFARAEQDYHEKIAPIAIAALRQALAQPWDTSDMAHRSGKLSVEQSQHPLDIYERAYFAGKQDGIDETIALLKVKNK